MGKLTVEMNIGDGKVALDFELVALLRDHPECRKTALKNATLRFRSANWVGFPAWVKTLPLPDQAYLYILLSVTEQVAGVLNIDEAFGEQFGGMLEVIKPELPGAPEDPRAPIPVAVDVRILGEDTPTGKQLAREGFGREHGGVPILTNPDTAMIPVALEDEAMELIGTLSAEQRAELWDYFNNRICAPFLSDETSIDMLAKWRPTLPEAGQAYVWQLIDVIDQLLHSGIFPLEVHLGELAIQLIESAIRGE